ncbi:FAD-dependent oxidoreductase [Metapseudomonas lalkuanensis]|uniref:FAD-dependent oxidoreductase n=1 Tax=Metapseudomonas lalkuanensis TaxID=2604832 RepID=UPI001CF3CB97|nr:FAD-dependent oxidoreductase [Pseudomonas lalkuanensis]UCP00633.1 FAD-dependent oxidoreductase [Pseudomonas lalkuanensis]
MNTANERRCDVLVIGSGASGLAAAVTAAHQGLDVLVAEKTDQLGGTSAWSGGWLWIPRNPLARAEGIEDSEQAVETYLRAELDVDALDERQRAFLHHGPEMVDFFQRHTQVQFQSGSRMPDMHESPGAIHGGRSLCALPYDGRQLGPWLHALRPPLDLISLGGMGIAAGADLTHFLNASHSPRSALYVAGRLLRHWRDRLLHGRGLHLLNGNALVARLLRSAIDLGVSLETGAAATRLLQDGQRIAGAELMQDGSCLKVLARQGVVLACGGFPHDRPRIARLFGHEHLSAAPDTNTGDGLRLGEAVGAKAVEDLSSPAAWAPVSRVPRGDGRFSGFPHLMERAKPGFIAVTRNGRRFTNEADSYHDFMNALFRATPAGEEPVAWLLCDHRAQRRYGIGWARPFPFQTGRYVRNGYLKKAASLTELARLCGIDGEGLQATVAAFNAHAERGTDPDFQRGASAYNQAQGEPLHGPNPSLGALAKGPFYAVKLVPGSLGTFAGLRTDASARALDDRGEVIPGLYVVGNDMASVMGGRYPSGGITLGPGMTFGYLAGLELARRAITPAGSEGQTRRSSPCAAP